MATLLSETAEIKAALRSETADMRAALQSLTASTKEENLHDKQRVEQLSEDLGARLFQLDAALAKKPSMDQITTRLSAPLSQILERLAALEKSTVALKKAEGSAAQTGGPTAKPLAAASAASKPSPPSPPVHDGTVKVVFIFEPTAHGSHPPADAVELFWVDKRGTQHKYSEIPHGMRVVETTRPGECWRARDATSGEVVLERYCATLLPWQEVVIH